MSKRLTTTEFIEKAKKVHGDRYDYSKVEYKTAKEKVHLICPDHGDFWQDAFSHTIGIGCPECGKVKTTNAQKFSTEEFIKRAVEIHGDKYDYSEVDYRTARIKVTIICREHGEFEQIPDAHLRGHGCAKCRDSENSDRNSIGAEEFIRRAREIHGDKYGYELVEYTDIDSPVKLICPIHGEYEQIAYVHLHSNGCRKCGNKIRAEKKTIDREEILARFRCMHGDSYDYSLFEYNGTQKKSIFICKKHGAFQQTPEHHMDGSGCPVCGLHMSKTEYYIASILEGYTEVVKRNRSILNGKEIDIFLPEYKIGIEYNGSYFHSEKFQNDPTWHLVNKQRICDAKGIKLIHISDYDPIQVVINMLKYKINADVRKVFARKCCLVKAPYITKTIKEFLNNNHIQGGNVTGTSYSLIYENEIVACMVFSNPSSIRGNTDPEIYELRRYASSVRVVGGASRLLAAFCRDHSGSCREIISYSDNRLFKGEMYKAVGFELIKEIPPDYKYVKGKLVKPKNHFKLDLLKTMPGFIFRPSETEHENCKRNNWYRLYDCGKKKWRYTL